MATSDLYIIAAGKGSRMNANVPKALVPITDEPCLTTTLQQIGHKFANVFIVTNIMVQTQWIEYFTKLRDVYPELMGNVHNLPIASGLGDGHATLAGIRHAEHITAGGMNQDIVIAWGDVFFPQAEIIDELLSMPLLGVGLLPAVKEESPYVTLLVNDTLQCVSADFSKYGENHQTGFHDQSVFRFEMSNLVHALETLHKCFWKNGRYITQGGELSLLYAFHFLHNEGINPVYVYETDYPTLSFNTAAEVAQIQKEIDTRWKHRFRK